MQAKGNGLVHLKAIHPLWKICCKFSTRGVWFSNGLTYWVAPFEIHTPSATFGSIYLRRCTHLMCPVDYPTCWVVLLICIFAWQWVWASLTVFSWLVIFHLINSWIVWFYPLWHWTILNKLPLFFPMDVNTLNTKSSDGYFTSFSQKSRLRKQLNSDWKI